MEGQMHPRGPGPQGRPQGMRPQGGMPPEGMRGPGPGQPMQGRPRNPPPAMGRPRAPGPQPNQARMAAPEDEIGESMVYEKSFADKFCIVTGASKGIGKACVRRLLRAGATVVLIGRYPAKLKEVLNQMLYEEEQKTNPLVPAKAIIHKMDLGDPTNMEKDFRLV